MNRSLATTFIAGINICTIEIVKHTVTYISLRPVESVGCARLDLLNQFDKLYVCAFKTQNKDMNPLNTTNNKTS